jgi:biotin synthase-related radical SAM superfamily protein
MNELPTDPGDEDTVWRVSSGSATVLGLSDQRVDVAPTTAYLMLGERCRRNCAFCAQARASLAPEGALSRVIWPPFHTGEVVEAVARAHAEGRIQRACFQVTVTPGHIEATRRAVERLAMRSAVPICASVAPGKVEEVEALLAAGAQRVTIALDAACERVYAQVKGGSWARTLALLEECAQRFPGRMGTHLIVGLGETEQEMALRLQQMADWGVGVGLFSFTPVAGTPLAGRQPPPLAQYRRMQAARWLIVQGLDRAEHFRFAAQDGRLVAYGLSRQRLREVLVTGEAFRTSGCPGCNRPYYNERPSGPLYNYPRPLTPAEAQREIEYLLKSLEYH